MVFHATCRPIVYSYVRVYNQLDFLIGQLTIAHHDQKLP